MRKTGHIVMLFACVGFFGHAVAGRLDGGKAVVLDAGADPVTFCASDMQDGSGQRTILQIDELVVDDAGAGFLEVTALGLDTAVRIGLFPLVSFSVERGDEPRRFLLAGMPDKCREISLKGKGVKATVSIHLQK